MAEFLLMATKQEDYIILASNVKSYSETNTISKFRTKLPRRREFPANQDWRVAVTEITYKQSWYNVKEDYKIQFINEAGAEEVFEVKNSRDLTIEKGYYRDPKDMLEIINNKLKIIDAIMPPKYYFNQYSRTVYLVPGVIKNRILIEHNLEKFEDIKFIPILGNEIESLLGLVDRYGSTYAQRIGTIPESFNTVADYNDTKTKFARLKYMFDNMKFKGHYPVDMSAGFNNLYIYLDIVEQTDIGDAYAPIVTTFPNKLSVDGFAGSVHHEPKNLIYRRLQNKIFDIIEVNIKDDSGNFVRFNSGNIVIKLHFQLFP